MFSKKIILTYSAQNSCYGGVRDGLGNGRIGERVLDVPHPPIVFQISGIKKKMPDFYTGSKNSRILPRHGEKRARGRPVVDDKAKGADDALRHRGQAAVGLVVVRQAVHGRLEEVGEVVGLLVVADQDSLQGLFEDRAGDVFYEKSNNLKQLFHKFYTSLLPDNGASICPGEPLDEGPLHW